MSNLVDKIERYIKKVLAEDSEGFVIVQRNLLASQFECAPSQINYVLSTRFSVAQGYLIESRRGGGGYLRIVKLALHTSDYLDHFINELSDGELSYSSAKGLIKRMIEEDMLSKREGMLLVAMLSQESLALKAPHAEQLRARLMATVIRTVAREDY